MQSEVVHKQYRKQIKRTLHFRREIFSKLLIVAQNPKLVRLIINLEYSVFDYVGQRIVKVITKQMFVQNLNKIYIKLRPLGADRCTVFI